MKVVQRKLDNNQYYTRKYPKKSIWIHFTAGGNAEGAINWWNQTKAHVGTAYVMDRDEDATIYEVFDPKEYAYHLGIRGDDNFHEKHGIGIEIANRGPIWKEGEEFVSYPLFPNKNIGRRVMEAEDVVTLDKPWRGHLYYHKVTKAQCKALKELILFLVKEFDIKVQDSSKGWNEYNEKVITEHLGGIWAHTTVRKDKMDMPPQDELMNTIREVFQKLKPRKVVPKNKRGPRTSH